MYKKLPNYPCHSLNVADMSSFLTQNVYLFKLTYQAMIMHLKRWPMIFMPEFCMEPMSCITWGRHLVYIPQPLQLPSIFSQSSTTSLILLSKIWGYGKKRYQLLPSSPNEDDLPKNVVKCLDEIPLITMCQCQWVIISTCWLIWWRHGFVNNKSMHFAGNRKGLNGH